MRRPDASMSLLADLAAHALDEGYLEAARRRGTVQAPAARRPLTRISAGVAALALVAAGVLFATSWLTTRQHAAAAARDRATLIRNITATTTSLRDLRARAEQLRSEINTWRDRALTTSQQGAQLSRDILALSASVGTAAVTGSGVEVVLDDAARTGNAQQDNLGTIYDRDLQAIANALFASGAEAIAINGQRLTALTSIREAGSAILVDYRPIIPPYRVDAIGPPDLRARFEATQTAALYRTWQQVYGLRFSVAPMSTLTLPAAGTILVHYAKPLAPNSVGGP